MANGVAALGVCRVDEVGDHVARESNEPKVDRTFTAEGARIFVDGVD